MITRRALFVAGAGGLVAGCDALGNNPTFRSLLMSGESANYTLHRLLVDRTALAKEFAPSQR